MQRHTRFSSRLIAAGVMCLLAACSGSKLQPTPAPTAVPTAVPTESSNLTESQSRILNSLELVDRYPLYAMRYVGPYTSASTLKIAAAPARTSACGLTWGCSLFAALGDEKDRLYGRNFDWEFSPALLLFTYPPDGYASVSMVDIKYLGFEGEGSKHLMDIGLEQRKSLLDAPWLPFDGMNEKGLVVGMAAVERQEMPNDPNHEPSDNLGIIREMLDHAATVDEAIGIIASHNIDMGSVPLHYLVASASGESALVEFLDGEMKVFRNETGWQAATNFLLSQMNGHPEGECPRYDRIVGRMTSVGGKLSSAEAFQLLNDVSQENTQWSVVYRMTALDLSIVMGRDYGGIRYSFTLK